MRRAEHQAFALAERLPDLVLEARHIAQTLTHGTHGRRRSGPGETFWQYRHYQNYESAANIDWRRSASSDQLFVREREWEAAHTFWLWVDLSPSMWFHSHLCETSKAERALALALALTDILVQAGERVGLVGVMPPKSGQDMITTVAAHFHHILTNNMPLHSLPPEQTILAHSECILLSDFLEDKMTMFPAIQRLASNHASGHLLQIVDPAEESLPYHGRIEFEDSEDNETVTVENAAMMQDKYHKLFEDHRYAYQQLAARLRWTFLVHHTDRPPVEPLSALHTRLSARKRGEML